MFDYSLLHWTTFFTAALLLNLSPGPDFAFILAQTASGGRKAGFAAMFGIWTGAFGHVLMAAAGLSAILAASAVAFSVVKWAGALYLIWLGIAALRSKGSILLKGKAMQEQRFLPIYRQGVIVSLLNPKVGMFFLAFLPQFVVPGAGPVSAQLFLHGFLVVLIAACIEPPLVLVGEKLTDRLRRSQRLSMWADRGLGVIFVGLGLRLAMQQR